MTQRPVTLQLYGRLQCLVNLVTDIKAHLSAMSAIPSAPERSGEIGADEVPPSVNIIADIKEPTQSSRKRKIPVLDEEIALRNAIRESKREFERDIAQRRTKKMHELMNEQGVAWAKAFDLAGDEVFQVDSKLRSSRSNSSSST
jgi:hypothetical protein